MGGGGEVPGAAAQQPARPVRRPPLPPRALRALRRASARCPRRSPRTCATAAFTIAGRARRARRRAGRRRDRRPRQPLRRLRRLPARTAGSTSPTTSSAPRSRRSRRPIELPVGRGRGAHRLQPRAGRTRWCDVALFHGDVAGGRGHARAHRRRSPTGCPASRSATSPSADLPARSTAAPRYRRRARPRRHRHACGRDPIRDPEQRADLATQ